MAGVKISALPAVASALLTDFFPVVQGGVTSQETLQQVATLFGMSGGIQTLAAGGTSANLTANNGGIFYSTATTGAILSGTATARQVLLSGATAAPVWSTSTYPATTAINQLLYSSSANVVAGLATGNSSVLVTGAGGIPALSTVLPAVTTTDPVVAQGLATKNYVDSIAQGLSPKAPSQAASTVTLTVTYANGASGVGATLTNAGAQAAFSVDGYSASANDRILIKDQSSTFQNGIYTVTTVGSGATNWVLTRAVDMDSASEFYGGTTLILNGTTQSNTTWTENTVVVTVGTTAVTFVQTGTQIALPVVVTNGGTGRATSTTAYGLLAAGTTATGVQQTLATGSAGQVLRSGGSSALPAFSTATYPATATNTGRILREDGTNWVETTSAFSDTYAASGFLYANGANNVSGLATANNGLPVTGNTGVPVLLAGPGTTGNILQSNAAAAPSFSTATYPSTAGTSGNALVSNGTNFLASVNVSSGTYTPTLFNTTNVAASTAYACQWMRVGSVVTVSGAVDVDPTLAATVTLLGMSLPVASNFGNFNEAGGTMISYNAATGEVWAAQADPTNDRITWSTSQCGTANVGHSFTFTYQII